ncbi:hypothetical protein [Paraoerskovia sediminicola]|uniref:hypothetical protein n=1 Tax=Paraoerskovia sediminicola TaxID=1138587 RepID=UPI002572F154|nr:hypothetical protein [Paraoerskovia sediminicola]
MTASEDAGGPLDLGGVADGNEFRLVAEAPAPERSKPESAAQLVDYRRLADGICVPTDETAVLGDDCAASRTTQGGEADCPTEAQTLEPLYTRTRDSADDPWSPWTLVEAGTCLTAADLAPEMEREFQTLPITPPAMTVQPPSGWTLVHFDTIAYTEPADATAQTFDITLLGVPVEVRAESSEFTFDFGDGSTPVVTTDPGAPYPDQTVTHSYSDVGRRTISLSTTWTGQFRIVGTPTWSDITGTAETTTTAPPIDVLQAQSRLVESTLD